ncbi:MAG TPA: phenylalanine--tRNA ligase subunit beta, partial [Candidatus Eisenbacteria bacterium]|nr:phenylalanine--tRNA ligase subunit beta [Candidatus Eisenbacteria bacterium]
MKFTLSWLQEFVPVKIPPEEIANLLTMAGLEVEAVRSLWDPQGEEDWLFEVNVTPNRGDCLSVRGLARELSAFTNEPLKSRPAEAGEGGRLAARIAVDIREPRACARYSAAVVVDLAAGVSPGWLAYRLESCGIRAINNIVDVTNYVMLETGQPLHAFDLDRLTSGSIVVRFAGAGERIVTLDGIERELGAGDLLICDGERPIALAGIMGGVESEVGAGSRRVLVESAHFDPTIIRRSAKRLGLHTEASHRFERGVDPTGTVAALERAAALLAECARGKAAGWVDRYPAPPRARFIELRPERVASLLGVVLDRGDIRRFLTALGLEVRDGEHTGALRVTPPPARSDLEREADLIEELARLYGYEKIPATLPALRVCGGKTDEASRREAQARAVLAGAGLSEVVNLPFTGRRMNQFFPGLWAEAGVPVTVLNPVAAENDELRLSLLPGLLENLRLNLAHKAPGFFAYHLGKVFSAAADGTAAERQSLAGILYGRRPRRGLRGREVAPADFFDGKGVV